MMDVLVSICNKIWTTGVANHLVSIISYYTHKERKLTAVSNLQTNQPYKPPKKGHVENDFKLVQPQGKRTNWFQSGKEPHRANSQSPDPLR